jgi:hypothetical protein
MEEIAPGLWHWTARHPHIGSEVSSYYLRSERVALDPLLPVEGLEWFDGAEPEHVVLSNRHHDRDAWRLQERSAPRFIARPRASPSWKGAAR